VAPTVVETWVCDAEHTTLDVNTLANAGGGGVAIVSHISVIHFVWVSGSSTVNVPKLYGTVDPCMIPLSSLTGGAPSTSGGLSLQFVRQNGVTPPPTVTLDNANGMFAVGTGAWETGLAYTFGTLNDGIGAGGKLPFTEYFVVGTVIDTTTTTLVPMDPLTILSGLREDTISVDCVESGSASAWSDCSTDKCTASIGTQVRWRIVTVPNALTGLTCTPFADRSETRTCTALYTPPCSTCVNGVIDVGESDIDCGGISSGCAKCGPGRVCTIDNDCDDTIGLACLSSNSTTTTSSSGHCLPRTFANASYLILLNVTVNGVDSDSLDLKATTALSQTFAALASATSGLNIPSSNTSVSSLYITRVPRNLRLRSRALSVAGDSAIITLSLGVNDNWDDATIIAFASRLASRSTAQLPLLIDETIRLSSPLITASTIVSSPIIRANPYNSNGGGVSIIILPSPTPIMMPLPSTTPTPLALPPPLGAGASPSSSIISTGGYIGIGVGAGLLLIGIIATALIRKRVHSRNIAALSRAASAEQLTRERRLADSSTDVFSCPSTTTTGAENALTEASAPSGLTKTEFIAQHRHALSDIGSSTPSESNNNTQAQVQQFKSPHPDETSGDNGVGVPVSPATTVATVTSPTEPIANTPSPPPTGTSPTSSPTPTPETLDHSTSVPSPSLLPVGGQADADSALATLHNKEKGNTK
jgi:hypothetical protein